MLSITRLVTTLALTGICLLNIQPTSAATYIVDQNNKKASDTNPGSEQLPFATIAAAAKAIKPGDTILVKNGTYREYVDVPGGEKGARITVAAWKGHRPAVKGSELLKGSWRQAHVALNPCPELRENIKAYAGGTPALLADYFAYLADKDKNSPQAQEDQSAGPFVEDPKAPFTGVYVTDLNTYTQMVFVNEEPLAQIGPFKYLGPKDWKNLVRVDGKSPADMRPGTFHYDAQARKLYVWLPDSSDPASKKIEISTRTCAFKIGAYTTLRGFDIRQCTMDPDSPAVSGTAIWAGGPEIVIEDCRVTHNDFSGISMFSDDGVIRNCLLAYNGNNGYTSSNCSRVLFDNNETHHNNTRNYHLGWHCGGVKVTHYFDSRFIGNYFHDEIGNSLWLDINCNNALVADNRFEDCGSLYFEISRWGVIVNNIFKNVSRGIWSYSSDVLIANNVLDSCGEGITVTGAIRPASYNIGTEPPRETLAAVRNNLIVNNIIIDSVGSFIGIWPDNPHCGNNLSDYNTFVWTLPVWHGGQNHIKFMGGWDQYYFRPSYWQSERGYDKNSVIVDPAIIRAYKLGLTYSGSFDPNAVLSDAGFVDIKNGNYSLRPDSPLRGGGINIPMVLGSDYYPGKRPWEKTLVEDAPDPVSAQVAFEDGPYKYYRAQPLPSPMFMLDPYTQPKGNPGINEEWKKSGFYPRVKIAETISGATAD